MSLSSGDEATIIGVGAAVLIVLGGGIWKSASLRGDANARWARRVDFAAASLDEQTITELEALRDAVDEALPKDFDPAQAIADPAPLSKQAAAAAEIHRVKRRMESALAGLMRLARFTIAALTAMAIGTSCATVYYAELWTWRPLRLLGLLLLGLGTAAVVVVAVVYVVLQDRLASAEDRAGTAGRAELDSA